MITPALRTPIIRTLILALTTFSGCCGSPDSNGTTTEPQGSSVSGETTSRVRYLNQGWDDDTRVSFYFTSQGSQLVPYYWFLALEKTDSEELFRSDENMFSLGYIPHAKSAENPDGLPIGFVKDDVPETAAKALVARKAYFGSKFKRENYPNTNAWLGFTCAACHTVDVTYEGKRIRVDGGPALIDHERFTAEMSEAFSATCEDDAKFERFAKRVLENDHNEAEADALNKRVRAFTPVLQRLVAQNRAEQAYGYGRLDAFGGILNTICATLLEIPANRRPSDAPVSYPFLWNTPHLDWVQWNGSADSPIGRNVGEAIGVYAHVQLMGTPETGQFTSTVRIRQLARLEDWVSILSAPVWPSDVFGAINEAKAAIGAKLYDANCQNCHVVRDENGNFPFNDKIQSPKKFIKTVLIQTDKIGTDDRMAVNVATRVADPGNMRPLLPDQLKNLPKVPAALLLKLAVQGTVQKKLLEIEPRFDQHEIEKLNGFRTPSKALPKAVYKARPLDGIWATAPYLHSGSVPNLYQLLLPEDQRVKSFYVGSNEFDPKHVGFDPSEGPNRSLLKTHDDAGDPIPGNSNQGHSGNLYTHTKNGREFTDEERWALVEYMKSLK